MSNTNGGFVDLMAELLSNPNLRERFLDEPGSVLIDFELSKEESESICSMSGELLNQQAELLINKRWGEVKKRIPLTIERCEESTGELFQFYASRNWPKGHLRHVIDAINFADFLELNQLAKPDRKELKTLRRVLKAS